MNEIKADEDAEGVRHRLTSTTNGGWTRSKVEVVISDDAPTTLGQVMQEWINRKDKERHGTE
jgi:hypothetical protein